jgi:hypothetical protein
MAGITTDITTMMIGAAEIETIGIAGITASIGAGMSATTTVGADITNGVG